MDNLLELGALAAAFGALMLFLWVFFRPRPVDAPPGDVEVCNNRDCAICKERRRRTRRMFALLVLIVPALLLGGCDDSTMANGWDTSKFKPHTADSFRSTPAGHQRDAGPFDSVAGGFVTEAEIDAAVDAGFNAFYATFPEFGRPEARIHITEDYVFWYANQWAGGACEGSELLLPLFTRGTSTGDPGAQFIKRAPDANYTWWRFTAEPLLPALRHELLHRVIDDPTHSRPEWSRITGTVVGKVGLVDCSRVQP